MDIIPAIDLKDGRVVRLTRGRYESAKVYSGSPAEVARRWSSAGAGMLHVVDLDGALEGKTKNIDEVKYIVGAVDIPVQLGGGLRDTEGIETAFEIGVKRVILGTKVSEDMEFLRRVVGIYGEKIVVSIDAKDGMVMSRGWTESSGIRASEMAARIAEEGVASLIYTDVSADGTLNGPNIAGIKSFLEHAGVPVIVAGGIASLEDIRNLSSLDHKLLQGVIIGKALYEGTIDLREAVRICSLKE